ncbi:MAG: hypothetical protein AB1414_19310 [bacterium]
MDIKSSNKGKKHNINLILVSLVLILAGLLGSFLLGVFENLDFWKTQPIGTTIHFLLKELWKVLFITGAVTIFLHALFKRMSEIESKEREIELREQLEGLGRGVKSITHELANYVKALDTMVTDGIIAIYKSRKDAKEAISEELMNEKNNNLRLVGISLRDFLKGDRLFPEEWKGTKVRLESKSVKEGKKPLKIQLLLINPCCEQAIYRAESEEPRRTSHRERNLFIEVTQILESLNELIEILSDKGNLLEVKIYTTSPSCLLMLSDNYAFVEQYHYREEITSGYMPVIQYDINSKVGKEMVKHFDFIWGKARDFKSYIKEKSIGTAEAIKDSRIINIYLDRELLTERLKYLIENVSGEIRVMGISLSSYIIPGAILISRLGREEQPMKNIRLLLINPLSQQAKYRASKESNHPYKDYTLTIHKEHRLYNDTMGSIREINRLAKLKSPIEGKVYSSAPSCFLFITNESVFIEQYHYGQTEEAKKVKETVLSRVVPVIEYSKDSIVYSLMQDHFDYVWKECSISTEDFEREKETLEREFDRI